MIKKLISLTAVLFMTCSAFSCFEDTQTLRVIALKVGKADCFVVLTQNGCTLIDAGETDDFDKIDETLKSNGVRAIDNLIITHFDKDHVGGAAQLLKTYEVRNVYTNDRSKDSDEYRAFVVALGNRERKTVSEKTVIAQDALTLTIYPPSEKKYAFDDSNNASLATLLEFEGKRLLFLADALDERIAELETQGVLADCDLLKIPHHGSLEESSQRLISICAPEYALITCSDKNPADAELLSILENAKASVFTTSNGAVTVTVKDGVMSVKQ